ncbi:hypothetical protein DY000_02010336, partial [Brassica cretica]
MVDKGQVISLCRFPLRAGHQYPDYNIREYAKRRTLDGFRMNKNLTDHSKVEDVVLKFPFPAMVDKGQVISLCRFPLRAGHQYPDYNIREYAKRRTLDGFRMNKNLTDHSKVEDVVLK